MKKTNGYTALVTVLIIIPVLILAGIALVNMNIDTLKSTKNIYNTTLLSIYSSSCKEESINKVRLNNSYTGSFNVSVNSVNCAVTISNKTATIKEVTNVTNDGTYYNYSSFYIDISNFPYQVTNKQ